ncbi:MAG: copper chaperone PCu(A)C [Sphingomonadales bacterium]|nr:copper chaperone PCu(A)C [Sphingomonadales bacterium]
MMVLLAGCGSTAGDEAAEPVEEAWVRLPAVDGRPGAAYFTLNGGEAGDVLIAVDSPAAATVELHESRIEGEAMTMRPVEAIEVPADGSVTLAPRGLHAMLFGLASDLEPGGTLPLNLRFDSGRDVQVDARIVGAGDPAPFGEAAE